MCSSRPLNRFLRIIQTLSRGGGLTRRLTGSHTMTHCPKCNTKVGVLRLSLSTRWSPYNCRGCAGKFQRRSLPATLIGGTAGGSAALIVQVSRSYHSVWIAVIGLMALVVMVILADWLLVPFDEVASNEPPTPA